MATIEIEAHAMDEIIDDLRAKGIVVTDLQNDWCEYRLEAPRAVLEAALHEHWYDGDEATCTEAKKMIKD